MSEIRFECPHCQGGIRWPEAPPDDPVYAAAREVVDGWHDRIVYPPIDRLRAALEDGENPGNADAEK